MATDAQPAIAIRGVTKRFLSTLALDSVDLTIGRGEIHALVGENGAGKSTLIKILAGIYPPDAGEIVLDGRSLNPHLEPVPIAFVHQDLGLVDELSIGENVALVAGFPRRGGLISWKDVWEQTKRIYAGMAIDPPDPRAPVGSLSAAGKAILGVVRALSRDARIVVLDEPTASLPGPDALHLFEVLRRLRASGTSILYVSHRLNELFGLVDRVTVLRDGRNVSSGSIDGLTTETIVRDMLGRDLQVHHVTAATGREATPLLTVENLCAGNQGPLSFTVGKHEIVGLVGLRGAGHEIVGRAIFGANSHSAGTIRLAADVIPADLPISARIGKGIALLAGNRLVESTLGGMSVRENLFPNVHAVSGALLRPIDTGAELRAVRDELERFDVRPRSAAALIDWLSGGNQQKIFVGRWLATGAKLFIMEEPTAGVDIGAKGIIHRTLRKIADDGAAVLVISSDFEEVATLCDRALVMGRGKITSELTGSTLTLEGLLTRSSMAGGQSERVH
ncbi:sugar ABC transporter ATP-binding protein [Bradyrhizobium tropiciagri]|uniref:sugar ABC transporter ATP-binding protein n=1 Tax=Bradyrhizobium tropiciagri TaxID=312253 RepID=UPI001BA83FD0|nr:sugar ABC transporter ATP-binding protein [Bradyrhizobium tropiciagri]MBR0893948.1 sugar ABC transporter ATP-binding protein [Bradyrhizobium tropiciagri]